MNYIPNSFCFLQDDIMQVVFRFRHSCNLLGIFRTVHRNTSTGILAICSRILIFSSLVVVGRLQHTLFSSWLHVKGSYTVRSEDLPGHECHSFSKLHGCQTIVVQLSIFSLCVIMLKPTVFNRLWNSL